MTNLGSLSLLFIISLFLTVFSFLNEKNKECIDKPKDESKIIEKCVKKDNTAEQYLNCLEENQDKALKALKALNENN